MLPCKVQGFQVGPDTNKFKKTVEQSIHHKIKVPIVKPKKTASGTSDNDEDDGPLPMVIVYDDDTYSPRIPSFSLKNTPWMELFQANASSTSSSTSTSPHVHVHVPPALPLSATIQSKSHPYIPTTNKLDARRTCGLDENPAEYWFHNKIHTFGNTGWLGMCHAHIAPFATTLINQLAYDGEDVRSTIGQFLYDLVNKDHARVLDLCCGVGISTRAVKSAFTDADIVVGVDTSPEMISMARALEKRDEIVDEAKGLFKGLFGMKETPQRIQYAKGNAERTIFPEKSFDLVTIMFAFHEAPKSGRYRMLREARRVLQSGGTLCVVDITPDYTPSPSMLAGEPYVLEYQQNIVHQLQHLQGFTDYQYQRVVDGHVGMWILTRK